MDINVKLVSSIDNATFYAKESGMFNEMDEEYEGKTFQEKGSSNWMWLDAWIGPTKVLKEANKVQKYFFVDSLVNTNAPLMLISNKYEDKASLQRAHLGVAKIELFNSCLSRSASILLSSRGFLDINNLFSYSRFIEETTQTVYRMNLTNTSALILFSILYGLVTGSPVLSPS